MDSTLHKKANSVGVSQTVNWLGNLNKSLNTCKRRSLTLMVSLAMMIGTSSCTNSAIIISPLYNQLERRMLSGFKKMADFDRSQIDDFRELLANFHYWHRRNELPKYAILLKTLSNSIEKPGQTRYEDIRKWLERTEQFTQNIRQCHPVNYSNDIIRSLTKSQKQTIEQRRTQRFAGYRTRYNSESQEDRIRRRTENTIKWAARIGFDFTLAQEQMLLNTHRQQISLRKEYYVLSNEWNSRLYDIINEADSPELDSHMAEHLNNLWHLLENAHPKPWRQNRELWGRFGYDFVLSLTDEQREYASTWISKMSRTIESISQESVSVPILGSKRGCALNSRSGGA